MTNFLAMLVAPSMATGLLAYLTCFCQLSASFSGQFDEKFSS
jgi:hypothetical protein